MHNVRVVSWVIFEGKMRTATPENSTSYTSEKLLQRCSGGRSIYMTLVKGELWGDARISLAPWKKSNDKLRQSIKKQRHYFADKGLYSQSYVFSSTRVWMWELDHTEGWKWKSLSHVWLFATPWTVVCQAPLSMEFSKQKYWSGLLCPSPGDLPNPVIEPRSPVSPALQVDSLPTEPPEKPLSAHISSNFHINLLTKKLNPYVSIVQNQI